MTIYDEIFKLRDSAQNSLSRVLSLPELKTYGSLYVATILVNGVAHTESFKFNPSTYAGDDLHSILTKLVNKAAIVDGEVDNVECTEGSLSYLLSDEYEYDRQRAYHKKAWSNGVTVLHDRCTVNIPGTAIRYTVYVPETPRHRRGAFPNWKTLDESVLVVINAVTEWKDPKADDDNKKTIEDWLVSTSGEVAKAQDYLNQLNKLVAKAMDNK